MRKCPSKKQRTHRRFIKLPSDVAAVPCTPKWSAMVLRSEPAASKPKSADRVDFLGDDSLAKYLLDEESYPDLATSKAAANAAKGQAKNQTVKLVGAAWDAKVTGLISADSIKIGDRVDLVPRSNEETERWSMWATAHSNVAYTTVVQRADFDEDDRRATDVLVTTGAQKHPQKALVHPLSETSPTPFTLRRFPKPRSLGRRPGHQDRRCPISDCQGLQPRPVR